MGDAGLKAAQNEKYLRVIINSKLSWLPHARRISNQRRRPNQI